MTLTIDMGELMQYEDPMLTTIPTNALGHNTAAYPGQAANNQNLLDVSRFANGIVTQTHGPWALDQQTINAASGRGWDSSTIEGYLYGNNPTFYDPLHPTDNTRHGGGPELASVPTNRSAHFTPQEITDWYNTNQGRPPTDEEMYRVALLPLADAAMYLEVTYYGRPITFDREKKMQGGWNANFERYYTIQSMAEGIFGDDIDPYQVATWVRSGASDEQILYNWRKSKAYESIFVGKPLEMTEAEYRSKIAGMYTDGDKVREVFNTFGDNITDEDLRKYFLGGKDSGDIRAKYAELAGHKASLEAMRGKVSNTTVTPTVLGPVQQLLKSGTDAYAQSTAPTTLPSVVPGDITNVAHPVSNALPITELFSTYSDFKNGLTNPNYRAKALNP